MLGSQVLEIAIGLGFVYLLLSVVSSTVNEWISHLWGMRSRLLIAGVHNLLNDPDGTSLGKALLQHPLVRSLTRPGSAAASYIPSRTFALALFDIILPTGTAPKSGIQPLRDAAAKIQNEELRQSVLILIDDAGTSLQAARENVEKWFDDAMSRVSGWYKRWAQLVIVLVATALTILANADTFLIVGTLSKDEKLRQTVAAVAEKAVENRPNGGTAETTIPAHEVRKWLEESRLPLGWSMRENDPRGFPMTGTETLMKIIGLLITAIATSLGAPFWFDLLGKLVDPRLAGRRPQPTTGAGTTGE